MTTPTAPTDKMTLAQFVATRETLRAALAKFEVVKPCCGSCTHFSMGTCELHGDVPKEFQEALEQCAEWMYDNVPF